MPFVFEKSKTVNADSDSNIENIESAKECIEDILRSLQDAYSSHTSSYETPLKLDMDQNPSGLRMNYITMELIINACDSIKIRQSTEDENYKGVINMKVQAVDNNLRVEIDDNGMGIDASVEAHLFTYLSGSTISEGLLKRNMDPQLGLVGRLGGSLRDIKRSVERRDGTMGYTNKGNFSGAIFWYELPLELLSIPNTPVE